MYVSISIPSTDQEFVVKVWTCDLVYSLMERIEITERIAIKRQNLILRGRVLSPNKAFHEYNITNGERLTLIVRAPIPIHLKMINGKTVIIQIDIDDSVAQLKEKIEETVFVRKADQLLILKGEELSSKQTLKQCGIKAQSELFLFEQMIIVKVETITGDKIKL